MIAIATIPAFSQMPGTRPASRRPSVIVLRAVSAAAALTALSTVTLGRILAGLVNGLWLKLGIVAMAIIDSILVFGNQLQGPNATLNAAIPVPGAPQLQYLDLHYASMGYGDVFVAGALWDLLFFHFNTLPATVPIAVAVILLELKR